MAADFAWLMARKYRGECRWIWDMLTREFGIVRGNGEQISEAQMVQAEKEMVKKYGEATGRPDALYVIFTVFRYPENFQSMTEQEFQEFTVHGGPRVLMTVMIDNVPDEKDPWTVKDMYSTVFVGENCEADDLRYGVRDQAESYDFFEWSQDVDRVVPYMELLRRFSRKSSARAW